MNRLVILYGCVLLSSTAIAEEQQSTFEASPLQAALATEEIDTILVSSSKEEADEAAFILSEIEFIEEEDLELGFDTKDYLPEGFSPYEVYFDLNSVTFVEDHQELDLGFDTSVYLPNGFDPYLDTTAVSSFNFIEAEDTDLGFDTMDYLPAGFSPYEVYFDLNSIIYIDINELDERVSICPWITTENNHTINY